MPRKTPPPDPDQPPFITDDDMPSGSLPVARKKPAGAPEIEVVYVLTDSAGPRAAPLVAFTTLAAARLAASRRAAPRPGIEVVPLHEHANSWDGR